MTKTLSQSDTDFQARAAQRRVTYTVRRFTDLDDMKAEQYRQWQRQSTAQRMAAVSELTTELYAMKGRHVSRLQRSLVRIERS